MIVKVKEPLASNAICFTPGQMLSYLHLAANRPLTECLIAIRRHGDRL